MSDRRVAVNNVPLYKFDKDLLIMHELKICLSQRGDIPLEVRESIYDMCRHIDYNLLYKYLYPKYNGTSNTTNEILLNTLKSI